MIHKWMMRNQTQLLQGKRGLEKSSGPPPSPSRNANVAAVAQAPMRTMGTNELAPILG